MIDEGGDKFYCQIRGMLQDQYCEKSVVITWLLPTVHSPSPNEKFDPATYIIGKYSIEISTNLFMEVATTNDIYDE